MIKVDVLLATYNGDKYLAQLLDSILQQNYHNLRLIIRDDGSTDNTITILKEYVARFPEKIRLALDTRGNVGVMRSFALLLEHSDAEYIMFADQDDVWLKDKMDCTINKMHSLEKMYGMEVPLLVHTDLFVADENLNMIANSFWKYQLLGSGIRSLNRLLIQNHITGCTMMINSKLKELSLPIPDGVIMHDWWIVLVAAAFGKIDFIQEPTIYYRQHGGNFQGATKWSIFQLIKDAINGMNPYIPKNRDGKAVLLKTQHQAGIFLKSYEKLLNERQQELVKVYSKLDNISFFSRKLAWLRHGYFPKGFLRNLVALKMI